jgi:hypothetical protein
VQTISLAPAWNFHAVGDPRAENHLWPLETYQKATRGFAKPPTTMKVEPR